MTPEEKRVAYNKLTKKELIELLIEKEFNTRAVINFTGNIPSYTIPQPSPIQIEPYYKGPNITCKS